MNRTDKGWALVTGASSGLGLAFAAELAVRGYDLVLTARREAPMNQLAERLRRDHQIEVVVEAADLADPAAPSALLRRLDERQIEPIVVINNAGFGMNGEFVGQGFDELRAMLQVDVVALTELTQLFGRPMRDRAGGHVLLVASMAAYQPTPILAAYGAAKAYVLSLGISLNIELAPKVGVTVLSPGLMETDFFKVSGYTPPASMRRTILPAGKVAAIGLDAMFAGKSSVIAGRLNYLMTLGAKFLTRHRQAMMAYKMSKE